MYIAMCVRTVVIEGVAARIVDSCLNASPQRNQAAIRTAGNTCRERGRQKEAEGRGRKGGGFGKRRRKKRVKRNTLGNSRCGLRGEFLFLGVF